VGIFVQGGTASLQGTFNVDLVDAGASSSDGRLNLLAFGGSGVSSDLGSLFNFLNTSITGTGGVTLPLFFGLKSSPVPMGNPAELRDFKTGANTGNPPITDPNSHFTDPAGPDDFRLPGNQLGLYVNFLEMFDGAGDGDDGFELRMPKFDLGQLSLPSLFTLLSDPSVIVKGLNSVLKELQGVLAGQLFGFKLPLIGDALAHNPVSTFIEDFRLNFLQPLADKISESNLNLDGMIGMVEGVINDVFGSFDVYVPVTHKFLKADGTTTTNVLEAKALQFDFDLGDEIIQTLANVDLNLGIPLLALKGKMEPRLKVDWNLHFGFGVDLDKGFYFVSKFDDPHVPGTDNPELNFSVALDLNSDDGTPAEIEATLAILKLKLTDGVDLNNSHTITTDEYTRLFLEAHLDLVDKRGGGPSGDQSDGKLTIPELITQSPRDTFVFGISGGATLLAHGVLDFGGLDQSSGLSLGSVL